MKPLSPFLHGPGRRRPREVIVGAAMIAALLGFVGTTPVSAATKAKDAKTKAAQVKQTPNPLPAMTVNDVKTGKGFALASAFTGAKPMLVWFWAPN